MQFFKKQEIDIDHEIVDPRIWFADLDPAGVPDRILHPA